MSRQQGAMDAAELICRAATGPGLVLCVEHAPRVGSAARVV
ncbi:MAG: hypothetical protein WBU92_11015 [Candidatus Dormiibacterota bacterium]